MKQTPPASGPDAPAPAVQAALQRAVEHHQAGRLREAEPLYRQVLQAMPRHADALHLLGVIALQGGDFEAAVDLIGQAIQVRPADNFYCNLGNALKALGRPGEAVDSFRRALALNPKQPEALCNLGHALLEQGQAGEAAARCRQAIALRPDFAAAHANLGNALLQQGQLDEAVASYRQALRIAPGLAVAHGNLGDALCRLGRAQEAIGCYRQALALGPDSAELHARMGRAWRQLGQLDAAIDSQVQALLRHDSPTLRAGFVQTIRAAFFQSPQAEVRALVMRALAEDWADAGELLTPATSLVESNPAVRAGIAQAALPWPGRPGGPGWLEPALAEAIAADALLLRLLETDSVSSIALERLLTRLRRQMLAEALGAAPPAQVATALQGAIAGQCFINEYVYACSDEEDEQLERLRARLLACHTGAVLPEPRWLLAWAAYAPLSDLAGAEAWAAQAWPATLAALFRQQVSEPAIERRLRAGMPRLTAIADAVSCRVRDQYEQHPYPRWTRTPCASAPAGIDSLLRLRLPGAAFQPLGKPGPLDVLVAGCGTGQHPIRVAQELENARVLAIDLSLASLAYAQRKTAEAGLVQIEYAQADILELGALQRRFDLIESAGVLHHLADPLAGWRALLGLLRPGGLMFLGLYSELGRRDVVAARRRVAEQGLPTEAAHIRRCRQLLMADALAPQFEPFLASRDFYSTSACRDLLFHVQEQRYTLPLLKHQLALLGLTFIGFEIEPEVNEAYARQFPNDPARTDLDQWHRFETENPASFARMYQFWVQKPGPGAAGRPGAQAAIAAR